MSASTATDFQILKSDLHQHRIIERLLPAPGPGQALLKVDKFALTANNITYGLLGESYGYWKFFPVTADDTYGIIPVWGFADVIASEHESLTVGQRYYGYLPTSTHLLVEPGRGSAAGFLDAIPHRRGTPSLYNQYALTSADPGYNKDDEDFQALLRPLFMTAFLLEDFIRRSEYFDARTLVVSSASSKTAYGTAYLLHKNKPAGVQIVGLTSARNRDFVQNLGCYDSVVTYDELASLDAGTPGAYFDFAGNADLRTKLHAQFENNLKYSCIIGSAHAEAPAAPNDAPRLSGPKPEIFFAPAQAKIRMREWKPAGFGERMAEAWNSFFPVVRNTFEINEITGPADLADAYDALLNGTVHAKQATIVRL